MVNQILLYLGAAIPLLWGVAHMFPTKSVVKGFGDTSLDNQRIITMEWIIEGVALIFIGLVVSSVTYVDYASVISRTIYCRAIAFSPDLSFRGAAQRRRGISPTQKRDSSHPSGARNDSWRTDCSKCDSPTIYWLSFGMLNVLSVISLFTGFKVNFLPFKLCPVLFTASSFLILLGGCL